MQKYEYLFIVVDSENGNDPGRPRYINGQELPNWKEGPSIFGVMNQLQWQGWEVVAGGLGYPVKKQLAQTPIIFKRPKA